MASTTTPSSAKQASAFPDGTTEYIPLRKTNYDPKKPHISELPMTWKNWYKHIDWLSTSFILIIPAIGLISTYWVPLQLKTAIWAVVCMFCLDIFTAALDRHFR